MVKRLSILAALIAVATVAALIWIWRSRPREVPLEAGWSAVAAVVAGDGTPGLRDDDAMHARFSDPFGVAAAADGSIYVADAHCVRRIAPEGTVSTLAGGDQGYADGAGTAARFSTPSGLALGPDGVLYVADTGNNMIRRVTPDGTVRIVAGGLEPGYRDGAAREARFNGPVGVAVDGTGRLIVADTYNDRIRIVEPGGDVITAAGSGQPGALDGPPAEARFDSPSGVAADRAGNIYVADTGNGAVRMIALKGAVTTIEPAGALVRPIGIAVAQGGEIYVTDDRGRVEEIGRDGSVRTIAGAHPGFADGAEARFRSLSGLAVAAPGRLIVTDSRNALVRLVAAPSRLGAHLPPSPRIHPQFDAEAFGVRPLLWPLSPMDGPYEITGTLGEARGGPGSERFHAGVDVHAPEGTLVRAVRPGTVTSPAAAAEFGTLNESIRIGPLVYVHVRVGRLRGDDIIDPARFVATYDELGHLVRMRVRRGARFMTGDLVGTTNTFNHVHLNVGWPGEEYNPLRFPFVQFEDTVAPTIPRGGIRLFAEDGQPLTARRRGRVLVNGRVRVVVDAWDQVDGNQRRRRLGVYRLGYQVLNRDGSPAPGFDVPRETIRFDRLAPDENAAPTVYASGSGIPFYGRRSTHFLYVVTNRFQEGHASTGTWDTTALAPGNYTLRILAADIAGNEARTNRDLPITIPPR